MRRYLLLLLLDVDRNEWHSKVYGIVMDENKVFVCGKFEDEITMKRLGYEYHTLLRQLIHHFEQEGDACWLELVPDSMFLLQTVFIGFTEPRDRAWLQYM